MPGIHRPHRTFLYNVSNPHEMDFCSILSESAYTVHIFVQRQNPHGMGFQTFLSKSLSCIMFME